MYHLKKNWPIGLVTDDARQFFQHCIGADFAVQGLLDRWNLQNAFYFTDIVLQIKLNRRYKEVGWEMHPHSGI